MHANRRALLKLGAFSAASLSIPSTGQLGWGQQEQPGQPADSSPANSESTEENAEPSADPVITPFLMFSGQAEQAMKAYVELFEQSKIIEIDRYGAGEPGAEGTVKMATFSLNGQRIRCIDSPVKHDFTFTPATSLYVTSADEDQISRYFAALSQEGQILMPLDTYPFSKKFGWVQDRFGVSWQLNAG
jgi:predicted 3-demethylubiquinone-9 3-methyltransferase (glyoxalase superfamily)